MRSIDALPIACIVASLGLARLWRIFIMPTKDQEPRTAHRHLVLGSWFSVLGSVALRRPLVAAGLAWSLALALNAWTYFVAMPVDREVWTEFYPLHTRVGAYIRSLADARGPEAVRQVYVPDQLFENPVFEYLAYQLPIQTFAGDRLSAPVQPSAQFVFPASMAPKERDTLIAQHGLDPAPLLVGPALPDGTTASFMVYRKR
jgi:hypothetical protein